MSPRKKLQAAQCAVGLFLLGSILLGAGLDLGWATLWVPGAAVMAVNALGFIAVAWADAL